MLNPKSFLYEQRDGIGTITLNRPDRLNAITFEVYHELTDFMAQLRDEKDVRVVVITGAGRAFCSGGDVVDIIGELTGRDAEGLLQFTRLTCELIRNMRALPKPIIASLNGTVAGAGACIALASDIRIAAAEPAEKAERAQHRFLHHVLGFLVVACQPARKVVRGVQMPHHVAFEDGAGVHAVRPSQCSGSIAHQDKTGVSTDLFPTPARGNNRARATVWHSERRAARLSSNPFPARAHTHERRS